MRVHFLLVPYDSGHREWRMGRGPSHLLRHGAGSTLRAMGHDVDAEFIELDSDVGPGGESPPMATEIASSFQLYGKVAARVRSLREHHALPIVLGGNCGVTLGAVAGDSSAAPSSDVGVVWLDAHGDFNTPDTSTTGFLDGMTLAALTGRGWRALTSTIPGFAAVPDAAVVLAGVRDLDPAEEVMLEESEVAVVRAASVRSVGLAQALEPALEQLRQRVTRLHLHVDLDVLDAAEARANHYASRGGLKVVELAEVVRLVSGQFDVASIAFTAYDPMYDTDSKVLQAVVGALEVLGTN
jgi:arginase